MKNAENMNIEEKRGSAENMNSAEKRGNAENMNSAGNVNDAGAGECPCFVVASNNKGKILEIKEMLKGLDVVVKSMRDVGIVADIDENGTTFEENAMIKARYISERVGGAIVMADDSGLCVDMLGGAPGVRSARFGGSEAVDDATRNQALLRAIAAAAAGATPSATQGADQSAAPDKAAATACAMQGVDQGTAPDKAAATACAMQGAAPDKATATACATQGATPSVTTAVTQGATPSVTTAVTPDIAAAAIKQSHLRSVEGTAKNASRSARFVCVIAVILPSGESFTVKGSCEGKIAFCPAGENGFGYDPIFYLPQYQKTMAQLDLSEKNKISPRSKAIAKMKALLIPHISGSYAFHQNEQ